MNLTDDQALTHPAYELLPSGLRVPAGRQPTGWPSVEVMVPRHTIGVPALFAVALGQCCPVGAEVGSVRQVVGAFDGALVPVPVRGGDVLDHVLDPRGTVAIRRPGRPGSATP